MPTSFSRSLRSLEADRFGGSLLGIAVGLSLLLAWFAWFALARVALYEVSDVARLEVDVEPHEVMSLISGRVIRNDMVLGREVEKGELLIALDALGTQYELEETNAEARGGADQLQRLGLEISAQRQARLNEEGLLAKAEADAAATAHLQRVKAAQALESSVERMDGEWQVDLAENRAELARLERELSRLESAVQSLDAVEDRLEHTLSLHQLRAPVAGRIGDLVTLKVSEVVSAGQHLGTIIPSGDVHVVAEFAPHRALGRIRSGQPAKLRLEGFSWVQYGAVPATVSRVGSEPSGGTIRVELRLDDPDAFPVELSHGLPGIIEVEVERISPAALVLRAAGNKLSNPVLSGVR